MNAPVLTYRLRPEEPAAFAELALVRVREAVTTDENETVPTGTRGTVVAVYDGGTAYEVEFATGLAVVVAADLVAA